MAKVTVEGVVSRLNHNGVGFGVRESWTNREGAAQNRYWAVWMPNTVPTTVTVGDEAPTEPAWASTPIPADVAPDGAPW